MAAKKPPPDKKSAGSDWPGPHRAPVPPKKPGAQATVTLKHLAARLAADHELTKREGEAILGDLVGLVTKHLKKGSPIRLPCLSTLLVPNPPAPISPNPATA